MKSILLCSYREWSDSICNQICKTFKDSDVIFTKCNTTKKFLYLISKNSYDLIFFIGWSDIIYSQIVNQNTCICLHPSLLPKYRGGSPIQQQIINGETKSGVTLFIMDDGIDTGPILFQEEFSLEDTDLEQIFENIIKIGLRGCCEIVNTIINELELNPIPQDNSKSSFFKRRTKSMSEITPEDFSKYTSKDLYNKIRALQDPYPNAFIRCKGDGILFLVKSKYQEI